MKFQVPLPLAVPLPNEVAPSMKVTVPVGVPGKEELTAAMNVTVCPAVQGFVQLARLSPTEVGTRLTVCTKIGEMLAKKIESPL